MIVESWDELGDMVFVPIFYDQQSESNQLSNGKWDRLQLLRVFSSFETAVLGRMLLTRFHVIVT